MTNKYLGVITGKEFQDKYNEMEDKGLLPRASTTIPIKDTDADETTALFHVWVFYDGKEQKPKEIKLDL